MKRTVTVEEAELAWGLFLKELKELSRLNICEGTTCDHLWSGVRQGDTSKIARSERAVGISVEVPTQSLHTSTQLQTEIYFHINVGYPILPPVEQCAGDVVFRMTGMLSKYAMDVISRECHLHMIELHESNSGLPAERSPKYILEVIKWASQRDMAGLVAAHSIPQKMKMKRSISRVVARFHHIESPLKSSYGMLWGRELNIRGYIGKGQPGFVMVEGDSEEVNAWVDRYLNVLHWGPIPAVIVSKREVDAAAKALPAIAELSKAVKRVVTVEGAFNGRNSIDFGALAGYLADNGWQCAADQLKDIIDVFQHDNGHVDQEQMESAIKTAATNEAERAYQSKQKPKTKDANGDAAAAKKKDKKKKRLQ